MRRSAGSGFTLVGLVIVFTVLSILLSAAMPVWSKAIQRDKEEELIFRGLQYAEAIRVFQIRNGRYPLRLEELLSVRPRSIRQLWPDPMTDNGEWGVIYAQATPGQRRGRRPGASGRGVAPQQPPQTFGGSGPRPLGGEQGRAGDQGRSTRTQAPIIGVHSLSDKQAIVGFFGGGKHSDWRFTADLVPVAVLAPDTLAPVRANARWVGRPFPPDLAPAEGDIPEQAEATSGNRKNRRRVNRGGD